MMITNVRGGFRNVSGTIEYDPGNPSQSSIDAIIDAKTINTNDEKRDEHLKSPDFLDVAQYPTITFKSRTVAPGGEGQWKATGDLTIHGVTKQVTLDIDGPTAEGKDPYGNIRIGASALTKIKRSEFGVTFNAAVETGGVMIGDELKIELDISAIRA